MSSKTLKVVKSTDWGGGAGVPPLFGPCYALQKGKKL